MNQTLLQRVRARKRQRGASFTEALVAIPFFIIIFALTMFVGSFYGEKLKTLRLSKECAWSHAMAGCNGGCPAETGLAGGESLSPPDTQDPAVQGAPGAQVMNKDWYQSKFTVESKATASGTLGGFEKPVSSTTTVMCNEEPKDGTLAGVASYIWDNASGL